jgi:DNA-binding response OmpR family regulator
MLTADSAPETAVRALNLGATDYVRKPFDIDELVARVAAARRRGGQEESDSGAVELGPLTVDESKGLATYSGQDIGLSGTEARVLAYLARHAGRVVSKQRLLEALWEDERDAHLIEVFISSLRRKLTTVGCPPDAIRTARGRGYWLEIPSTSAS